MGSGTRSVKNSAAGHTTNNGDLTALYGTVGPGCGQQPVLSVHALLIVAARSFNTYLRCCTVV